jgi:Flp pilus assembly pilin Flp
LEKEYKMLSLINRFRVDERGATAVEYAMLVVFVGLAVAVTAQTFSTNLSDFFARIGAALAAIVFPTP